MFSLQNVSEALEGICFGHYIDQVKFSLFDEICSYYVQYEHLEQHNVGVFLDYDVLGIAVNKAVEDFARKQQMAFSVKVCHDGHGP